MNADERGFAMRILHHLRISAFICGSLFLIYGCERVPAVVVYTSVDEPYAAPIIQAFEKETGIKVRLVTDTEASKSVGLAERLRAEKGNPQCDVWWGNEPFNTINLAEEGLLQPYASASTGNIDPMYRDPEHRWAGNGLRARVMAISGWAAANTAGGIDSMTDPRLKGKIGMARPAAGTTGGHVAAIYVTRGDAAADEFFGNLRKNDIKLLGGNGPVAQAVGAGTLWAGLTDNDDCTATQREGGKLSMSLLDQGENHPGTLMIPTTVGLVSGTKRPDAAKKLIDYLLSPAVEQKLMDAKFAGWSVRGSPDVKAMSVDYREVSRVMPQAVRRVTEILEGR